MRTKVHLAIVVIFQLVLCTMISQIADHCDYVPWGNHSRDGLDFLVFPLLLWPALFVLSLAELWAYADEGYHTFAYLIELLPICVVSYIGMSGASAMQVISMLLLTGLIIWNCLSAYRKSKRAST